jgi:hypothetical protein
MRGFDELQDSVRCPSKASLLLARFIAGSSALSE